MSNAGRRPRPAASPAAARDGSALSASINPTARRAEFFDD